MHLVPVLQPLGPTRGRALATVWALAALSGAALPSCAAPPAAAAGYTVYDYGEQDENLAKNVRLAMPTNLTMVRGLLVHTNAAGGDTRERYKLAWLKAFAALHGFAFVGAQAFNSHPGSVLVLEHALARFAADSGHPELLHAPFAVYGLSAGAGFANRLANMRPERVIASASLAAAMRTAGEPAVLATPVCLISGEQEDRLNPILKDVMTTYRPRGARWSWATSEGMGHREFDQMALALLYLDHCVRLRYPSDADPRRGPVALRPLDEATGWLADHATCRTGLTAIAPFAQFKGDPGQTSWLPDQDLAFVYRAYATFGHPLKLTSPKSEAPLILSPGAKLEVTVDDTAFAGWKRLELYDGAKKLGELNPGPAKFSLSGLTTGVHALHVLGVSAKDTVAVSRPALVIVTGAAAR